MPASAILALRLRLREQPGDLEARLALARLYASQGRGQEALALLAPGKDFGPELLLRFGEELWESGARESARAAFESAREGWPDNPQAAYREAFALLHLRRLEEARAAFRQGTVAFPGDARFRFQLGWIEALRGDLREGLGWMESRVALRPPLPELPIPAWRGGDPRGKRLLLRVDQGFGDVLMTCRFAGPLARAGAEVFLETPAELAGLLDTLEGPITRVRSGDILNPPLEQVPLMSVPFHLGTTLDSLPGCPYLRQPDSVPHREALDAAFSALGPGPRVGLAWAGNAAFPLTRERDLDPESLETLLDAPGIQWVSLQKEAAFRPASPMLDLAPLLGDFSDTAYALSRLDLVVTIDSAIAHLAGALGRPAWVLLPFLPDWRWLLDRPDSPWYPSLRLWRQMEPRQWKPVVEALGSELRRHFPFP